MDFPRRARANFTSLGTEIQGHSGSQALPGQHSVNVLTRVRDVTAKEAGVGLVKGVVGLRTEIRRNFWCAVAGTERLGLEPEAARQISSRHRDCHLYLPPDRRTRNGFSKSHFDEEGLALGSPRREI
jgi:hypothetical protein